MFPCLRIRVNRRGMRCAVSYRFVVDGGFTGRFPGKAQRESIAPQSRDRYCAASTRLSAGS